uniref:Uncharacterized protein n=1 Tax=Arundo donax TaxID=35708 RepID=A0A0A9E5B3_ARUDO
MQWIHGRCFIQVEPSFILRTRHEENLFWTEKSLAHQEEPFPENPGACSFLILKFHKQPTAKLTVFCLCDVIKGLIK